MIFLFAFAAVWNPKAAAVEIRFAPMGAPARPGAEMQVCVLVSEQADVLGVDLRLQFDREILELREIEPRSMARFSWIGQQTDSTLGYALTGLVLPGQGEPVSFVEDDTLALLTFLCKRSGETILNLKPNYPVMIDRSLRSIPVRVEPLALTIGSSGVAENGSHVPGSHDLVVYPNPFQSAVSFLFRENEPGSHFLLRVYNLRGRLVWERSSVTHGGWNRIEWDGKDNSGRTLPAGIYFAHLQLDGKILRRKCVIIR